MILPAKFRDELAGGVVITKGQERCLYVFPGPEIIGASCLERAAKRWRFPEFAGTAHQVGERVDCHAATIRGGR